MRVLQIETAVFVQFGYDCEPAGTLRADLRGEICTNRQGRISCSGERVPDHTAAGDQGKERQDLRQAVRVIGRGGPDPGTGGRGSPFYCIWQEPQKCGSHLKRVPGQAGCGGIFKRWRQREDRRIPRRIHTDGEAGDRAEDDGWRTLGTCLYERAGAGNRYRKSGLHGDRRLSGDESFLLAAERARRKEQRKRGTQGRQQ